MAKRWHGRGTEWRGPGTAFALSLAVHAALLAGATWLFGSPTGPVRGEARMAVTLAPAPAAASVPAPPPATPGVASFPTDRRPTPAAPAEAAPRPAGAAAPVAVLASTAEAEDEAERRRREALAERGPAGIAVPSHSLAAPTVAAGSDAMPPAGADARAQRGFVELHVLDWLARHRQYPRAARRAGLEGTVHVRFVIDPAGRIADAAVERSSGVGVLDRAALELLGRASPVPGLAQFGLAQGLELRLPIDFRLRRDAPAG